MHKNAEGEIEVTNGKVTMLVGDYVNYDETAGVDLTDITKTQYRSLLILSRLVCKFLY